MEVAPGADPGQRPGMETPRPPGPFKPIETELFQEARRRGARAIHGGRMLLHQAAGQFELYTGAPAPLAAMEAALSAQIGPGAPTM
jgi:hypothetical protein